MLRVFAKTFMTATRHDVTRKWNAPKWDAPSHWKQPEQTPLTAHKGDRRD